MMAAGALSVLLVSVLLWSRRVSRIRTLDRVHGAHIDGDRIVLSKHLGGTSHGWTEGVSHTTGGCIYLVYQECDVRSRFTGGMLVSSEPVPENIAMSVCGSSRLTGSLSLYTPDRETARDLMSRCHNIMPQEFSFSGPQMSQEFSNWRNPNRYSNFYSGPMCLYGESKGTFSSNVLEDERRKGYTVSDGRISLSLDLGGMSMPAVDIDDWDQAVEPGTFRVITGMPKVLAEGKYMQSLVSLVDVPRDVALAICADTQRFGFLSIYTPDRQDALDLMTEAIGKHTSELVGRRIYMFKASMFVNPRLNEALSPKAIYGEIKH